MNTDQQTGTNKSTTKTNFFRVSAEDFKKIPGSPIAYWASKKELNILSKNLLSDFLDLKAGLSTGNNEIFQRDWYEINYNNISIEHEIRKSKWYPCNSGGNFRKWYGNNCVVVNWEDDGDIIRKYKNKSGKIASAVRNEKYYKNKGLTWSKISSSSFSMRYMPNGFLFDDTGRSGFKKKDIDLLTVLPLLCSKIALNFLSILAPTLSFTSGEIARIPILVHTHEEILTVPTKINLSISKSDWDLRETSWDFLRSPLLTDYSTEPIETIIDENLTDISWPSIVVSREEVGSREYGVGRGKVDSKDRNTNIPQSTLTTNYLLLSTSYTNFTTFWTKQFKTLHKNEEELNRIFIDLYELQDELTPDVPYSEITILQSELEPKALKENKLVFKKDEILRQFISYAVGCIFGRYSLDKDGLILAHAGDSLKEFLEQIPEPTFMPDKTGILPITDENDFTDDLPSQFTTFLKASFGSEHFQENLRFVEEAIGKDIRSYFLKDFYKDHVKRYKKRPIYWMIPSPSGAFRALIYLHRYTKDTISIFLNDYLRVYMRKLTAKIKLAEQTIISGSASSSDKTIAQKNIDKFRKVLKELEMWERDVVYSLAVKRVELDLDDGVKVNYGKLGDVLEKVKGLNA